jgi:hypothetical protein
MKDYVVSNVGNYTRQRYKQWHGDHMDRSGDEKASSL